MELLDSFGLVNHIQFATHEHENTPDLIITLERETFVKNPSWGRLFCDHNVVLYDVVSTKFPKPPKETIYIEGTKQWTIAVSVETWQKPL